jgi:radical SAM superfamily enzyme YgiQ (UPF0313 family)
VTIDVTDDPSLIREMALAGCTGVFVGFESLAGENLVDANKKTPSPDDYARRVAILHDHGIQVNVSFVLGFDHDRADVFERTVAWIEAARLEGATFHILTPYPGTPLFRQMETEGRLLHKDSIDFPSLPVQNTRRLAGAIPALECIRVRSQKSPVARCKGSARCAAIRNLFGRTGFVLAGRAFGRIADDPQDRRRMSFWHCAGLTGILVSPWPSR